MLKNLLQTISILGLATAGIAPVAAESSVLFESEVMVVRTVEANGVTSQTYEEPESVLPGDRLLFSTSFSNQGADAAQDIVITNPLPGAVALAENGDFVVSIDGGNEFAALSDLTVEQEDGTTRPAALTDVTHLRWTITEVAAGSTGNVQYFAFVR